MADPVFAVRAAGQGDLRDIVALRDLAGPGFTSLAVDDRTLGARLEQSFAHFAADITKPGAQRYLLALEHIETGRMVGLAGVKACIGTTQPFFNFRVLKIAQCSAAAQRRFDLDVLILVNEFMGCSEVGSLFVHPGYRAGGVGRALAQTRYMLMAAAPHRFCDTVVSELRGVVDEHGKSPFWEHLGRTFFRMDFAEADRFSAVTDNQFILDLMPKYPIYADLLPAPARAVIGQAHADGAAARKLLEWEGFRYADVVDIFDAGPILTAPRETIRTRRESRAFTLASTPAPARARRALIATPDFARFRCVACEAEVNEGVISVTPAVQRALGVAAGENVIAWVGDAV
jgi:arginine N-succinyltransferase